MSDLARLSSGDLGAAYLASAHACQVLEIETEMRRRGEIDDEHWSLVQARWPRDMLWCAARCSQGCRRKSDGRA